MKALLRILLLTIISIFAVVIIWKTCRPKNNFANPSVINAERKVFTEEETKILNLELGMGKSEVERILGKPHKTESFIEDAFGFEIIIYYYDFGSIRFEAITEEHIVAEITIDKPGFKGPRDIQVGEDIADAIKKFPYNENSERKDGYRYLYGTEADAEYGYITYDENNEVSLVTYVCNSNPESPEGSIILSFETEKNKIALIRIGKLYYSN